MEKNSRKQRRGKRKSKRVLKVLLALASIFLLVVVSGAGYLYLKAKSAENEFHSTLERGEKSELRTEAVDVGKHNFSVLLLGDDARPGEDHARTDAILVATFNRSERSIILTSIPRDSYVEIAGRGTQDKINHANAFGGIDMTVATVENFLDIPIDYYATVKFDGFKDIVDALDGIDVDVKYTFDFTEGGQTLNFTEGPTELDGEHALAYTRERKSANSGGDFGRGQRQAQVMAAIIDKAASFQSIDNFGRVFDSLGSTLRTDLSFANLVALHGYAGSISEIEQFQLEGEPFRGTDGVSYVRVDETSLANTQNMLQEHLGLQQSSPTVAD
ncbi:LCP family glycopolymer transferase [Alkalicoccobacillus murimartini]|uniref:LCP family protein required for cell wall assembly n=1 Tax=Alkalicoccobacillus murimartini TaxID=171685 RepID=A0ABT9YLY6_9BACI|nr:LCP family protein [Alkalicoccobacillus murimartini]MDQ0208896.1 LCP family protein required for cell wall assembly [Alkalicoccobacillus murimartini]